MTNQDITNVLHYSTIKTVKKNNGNGKKYLNIISTSKITIEP